MKIKVKKLTPTAQLPRYQTSGAACFDLSADSCTNGVFPVEIPAGGAMTFGTGLAFGMRPGYCIKVFSRSGHGFKNGVRLCNSVGVIDADYTGEVMVRLQNDGHMPYVVNRGDRIAQAQPEVVFRGYFEEVAELDATERGARGIGSTGV